MRAALSALVVTVAIALNIGSATHAQVEFVPAGESAGQLFAGFSASSADPGALFGAGFGVSNHFGVGVTGATRASNLGSADNYFGLHAVAAPIEDSRGFAVGPTLVAGVAATANSNFAQVGIDLVRRFPSNGSMATHAGVGVRFLSSIDDSASASLTSFAASIDVLRDIDERISLGAGLSLAVADGEVAGVLRLSFFKFKPKN